MRISILLAIVTGFPCAVDAQPPDVSRPVLTVASGHEWTLDEVLAAALAQHPLVEAARARVSAAQGARGTAAALPNPVATYWLENSAFPGPRLRHGLDPESSTYVTLPIEPLFQRSPRVQRANEDIKAADAALSTARRQVALDAVHAFFRVALAQVSVDAAEENRAALERLASYNRSRVGEGATAEGELIRVQVELDRAATELVLAQVDLTRSRAGLRPVFGDATVAPTSLDSIHVSVPALARPVPTLAPLGDFMSRARQSRPELVAAQARAAATVAAVDYERVLTIRQMGATFGLKRAAGQNTMIAGIGVAIPLFDQNRGGIQRATGERLAAAHELVWEERTVAAEVQAAYEAAQRLSAQASALQPSFLDRAEESRTITLTAYEEGAASLLQVLDASRAVADARLTYSRLTFAQRQSIFDLMVAAGSEPRDALAALHASLVIDPAGPIRDGGAQ
jgi:cobalt-zinc-cadmium efflux system outer membrane protein